MSNIKFNYLYRDASNYKAWGEVIFSNPDSMVISYIDKEIRNHLDFEECFIAWQIGIPDVFLYKDGRVTIEDHCYHEYYSIELTELEVNDIRMRSINLFISDIKKACIKGWAVFDPADVFYQQYMHFNFK